MRPVVVIALLAGCAASGVVVGTGVSGAGREVPGAAESSAAPRLAKASPSSIARRSPTPRRPPAGERWGAALPRPTALRARPLPRSHVVARVSRRTPFGSPTVLPVVRQRGQWLGVLATELGNGRVGWVRAADVELLKETWAIDVDLSSRRAVLTHFGRRYLRFPVAVGTPAYPTPTGRFGVTDLMRPGYAGSPYGCCILALSAHQPHIAQDWPGGDRIAIHGTVEPGSVGTAASHGCLRASAAAMRVLLAHVPLGTPVVIHA